MLTESMNNLRTGRQSIRFYLYHVMYHFTLISMPSTTWSNILRLSQWMNNKRTVRYKPAS